MIYYAFLCLNLRGVKPIMGGERQARYHGRTQLLAWRGAAQTEKEKTRLTATDHAVFARQRVDVFRDDDIASTKSLRQHKDATDLVCQPMYQTTVGALASSDHKGPNSQYVGQDKLVVDGPLFIRRLSPVECERLQEFLTIGQICRVRRTPRATGSLGTASQLIAWSILCAA